MADDDAIAFIISTNAGSGRASTPQATRPSSRPRSVPKRVPPAVHPPAFSDKRAISRRKQRRWENDNLMGTHKYGQVPHSDEEHKGDLDIEHVYENFMRFSITVDWRSLFAELLEVENEDVRLMYLSCANTRPVHPQKTRVHRSELQEAQEAWMQVEKRLRSVVIRATEDVSFCSFIQALEATLLYFVENDSCPSPQVIPSELSLALSEPLSCAVEGNTNSLVVPLIDSAFHRLLLHASCQFYGLKSKSMDRGDKRVTLVSRTRRRSHHISLVAYILATTRAGTSNSGEGLRAPALPSDLLLIDQRSDRSASDEWLVVEDVLVSVPSGK